MIVDPPVEPRLAAALAAVARDAAARIAGAVPDDVAVTAADGAIRVSGRALARRALGDARLRDFAGLAR